MKRLAAIAWAPPALAFALALGARAAVAPAVSDAPPSGIAPARVTLAHVLDAFRRASGTLTPGTAHTREEHWKTRVGSFDGSEDEWRSGAAYRADNALGPTHEGRGSDGTRTWRQNSNGQIAYGDDLHRRDDIDERALYRPGTADMTLLGETKTPSAYVVRLDPPGGRLEYVFFDKQTHLIARIEAVRDGRRSTITFDDYRATKGLVEPWHLHSSDGFATNDSDDRLVSLAIGDRIAPEALAPPTPGPPVMRVTGPPVDVPVQFAADFIVVPVKMGGHTVDFIMDSGASSVVIDDDVVKALNFQTWGKFTGETAGKYVESEVVIPKMTIGSLEIDNLHASSLPFTQWMDQGRRPVAGLLGFDFIHDVVWHVDYADGTLQAIDPASFAPPAGAVALDATFNDFVPTVRAAVAGVAAPALVVDTGADRSTLFSPFVDEHRSAIADRGLGEAMIASAPFIDEFSGVGGTVEYRPLQAGPFVVGGWTFPKWLFDVTQNARSFELEDYDGLLGQDFLRNFEVYLDYPHGKLYLVPNDRFKQRWPNA